MTKRCDICNGRGQITLRRIPQGYTSLYAPSDFPTPPNIQTATFPCPQCSDLVETERLLVVQSESMTWFPGEASVELENVTRYAAHALAEELHRTNRLTVIKGPISNNMGGRQEIRVSIGIVTPERVATFDQRVAAHQDVVAREVAKRAAEGIRVWDSLYTGDSGNISKRQAVDSVNRALDAVLAERKPTQPEYRWNPAVGKGCFGLGRVERIKP